MSVILSIPARHVTSEEAMRDVAESYGVREVRDSTAVTIASWWQSSGTIGRHLASLASGAPVLVSDVLDDIARTRAVDRPDDDDSRALDMLATFVLADDTAAAYGVDE